LLAPLLAPESLSGYRLGRLDPGGHVVRIVLKRGDITEESVGAIVNAANAALLGGGGVDGAIHRAGGPAILEACRRVPEGPGGRCPPGGAVVTTAGRLDAEVVIHTVGPIWQGGDRDEAAVLSTCYERCLAAADERGLRSVAFPAISTGAYGFPIDRAANVALRAVRDAAPAGVEEVRFVLFSDEDLAVFRRALAALEGEGS
jgi:O-acetyl-ADP-ribose deacetylase (regulator of RNase III)